MTHPDMAVAPTASGVGLDSVEFGDSAQALGRDLRAAVVVDLAEPAPTMRPTIRKLYRRPALARQARGRDGAAGAACPPPARPPSRLPAPGVQVRRGCRRSTAPRMRAGSRARGLPPTYCGHVPVRDRGGKIRCCISPRLDSEYSSPADGIARHPAGVKTQRVERR